MSVVIEYSGNIPFTIVDGDTYSEFVSIIKSGRYGQIGGANCNARMELTSTIQTDSKQKQPYDNRATSQ